MIRRKPYEAMTSMDDFEDVMYKIQDDDHERHHHPAGFAGKRMQRSLFFAEERSSVIKRIDTALYRLAKGI